MDSTRPVDRQSAALDTNSTNGAPVSDSNSGQFPDPWAVPQPPSDGPGAPHQVQPPPPTFGGPPVAGGYGAPPPGYVATPAGYGPPPGPGPQQPYGQPGYPQAVGYAPTQPTSTPASTIVLMIVSALSCFTCYLTLAGIVTTILAIVAVSKSSTNPDDCRRLTKIGWIVYAVLVALSAAGIVALIVNSNNSLN